MNSPNPTYMRNKWLVVHDGVVWNIVDDIGLPICTVNNGNREPASTNALAHLIRTAPELLSMVHSCMRTLYERLDVLQDERRERLRYFDDTDHIDYQIGIIRSLVRNCDFVVGMAERLGDPKPSYDVILPILHRSSFKKK